MDSIDWLMTINMQVAAACVFTTFLADNDNHSRVYKLLDKTYFIGCHLWGRSSIITKKGTPSLAFPLKLTFYFVSKL